MKHYTRPSSNTCLLTLLDPDLQPEEHVELHELQRRFLEAIVTLPTRYRAIALLHYTNQLSYREIEQMLHMPEPTAKTYFYRASKLLRSLLGFEFACYTEVGKAMKEPS